MNRNYIIFFWIICLIIFTFYCVFRLKYLNDTSNKKLKEKYYNATTANTNPSTTNPSSTNPSTTNPSSTNPSPTPLLTAYTGNVLVTRPEITKKPIITKTNNFITYIKNIQDKDKITDMKNCEYLYDDNIKVNEIGYRNCGDAYADYLDKNYDINKKYGHNYTLADVCPIAAKTSIHAKCLQLLLTKFSNGADLINSINTDMTNSINARLTARTENLHNIQESINPFIYSNVQNDFNNNMLMKKQIGTTIDDKLNLINKYYQDKYQVGIETFTNVTLTDIEKNFFGKYKPIKGQFFNLSDLLFTIEYDDSYIKPKNNNIQSTEITQDTLPQSTTQDTIPQPTLLSQVPSLDVKSNSRPVIFTISNNDIFITYKVSNIDFYKLNKTTVKLMLTDKTIIYQSSPTNIVEPLLKTLGLYAPSSINLVFEPYTSTENKEHNTYRLVNDNLDTILILKKEPTPQTTTSKI